MLVDDHVTAHPEPDPPEGAIPGGVEWTRLAWVCLAIAFVLVVATIANDDFRTRPLYGDQASFLLQGLSLSGDGHNLSFDAADLEAWRDAGWSEYPNGLFVQRRDAGWAFAKPYGFSAGLAPFLMVFSPPVAVALANALMFTVICLCVVLILRQRYSGVVVPVSAGAFCFGSYVMYYAFTLHSDLFLAMVSALLALLLVRIADARPHLGLTTLAFAIGCAFILSEKASFLALLAFPLAWLVSSLPRWRERAVIVGVLVASFAVFCVPYIVYSDGASMTPYGGDRYGVSNVPPFVEGGVGTPAVGSDPFTVGFVVRGMVSEPLESAQAFGYYFVGRHTGMIVFIPAAVVFLALAAVTLVGRRRWSALWGPGPMLLLGVFGYIILYTFVFSSNYYGGGQSIGNRYFLQVAPFTVGVVALVGVKRQLLIIGSTAALVFGLVVLSAHHAEPRTAFTTLKRTSAVQRLFPFEYSVEAHRYFITSSEGDDQ